MLNALDHLADWCPAGSVIPVIDPLLKPAKAAAGRSKKELERELVHPIWTVYDHYEGGSV